MSWRKWARIYYRMPIKFKLTLGSTLLIMALLIGYNFLQYVVMEQWIIHREKKNIQDNMSAILNELLEQEMEFNAASLAGIKQYLDMLNRDDQRIRILGADNNPLITVTDNVQDSWLDAVLTPQQEIGIYRKNGHALLIMKSPLTIHQFSGTVEIVKSLAQFEALTKTISRVMIYFALGAVALSVLVGWLLTRNLLRPLQDMAQTIRDVNNKGMQERMSPAQNGDEISTLMLMFNDMMDRVEAAFRRQSRFVEDASHELRTPVAIIEGHLALLRRWGKEDPAILNESLDASLDEFARLKRLVMELLALSRADKEVRQESLSTNLPRAIELFIDRFALIHTEFQFETDVLRSEGIALALPIEHLEQILLIILDNAVKYSLEHKEIVITAEASGEQFEMSVTDHGMGIPAKDIPYVTDRFYRVDKARSRDRGGNGLGLAIAKGLIERYDGTLVIHSEEHSGTTVTVRLPCIFHE